jgi:hypothetical protein
VSEVASAAAATPNIFICWSRPLVAVVKAGPGPQQCITDQVGGAQGGHTVGGVQVVAVDATGSTSRTVPPAGGKAVAGPSAVGSTSGDPTSADPTSADPTAVTTTQGASANAAAASARLVVNKTVIQIGAVTSMSRISCTYSTTGARYTFNGASTVRSLRINGKLQQLGVGLRTFHIVGGGTLYLDRIQVGKTGVVVQAAVLETPKAHVVLGESAVDLAPGQANPCR